MEFWPPGQGGTLRLIPDPKSEVKKKKKKKKTAEGLSRELRELPRRLQEPPGASGRLREPPEASGSIRKPLGAFEEPVAQFFDFHCTVVHFGTTIKKPSKNQKKQ